MRYRALLALLVLSGGLTFGAPPSRLMSHASPVCLFADPPAPAPTPAPPAPPAPTVPSVIVPATASGIPGEWIPIPFSAVGGCPEFRILDSGLVEVDLSQIFGKDAVKNATARVYKASAAGVYHIEVRNALGSTLSAIQTVTVTIGQPTPVPTPPAPGPTPPAPNPSPTPVATSLAIGIVEDANVQRSLATANVVGDTAFWTSLGVKWAILDNSTGGEADRKGFLKVIAAENAKLTAAGKPALTFPILVAIDPSKPVGQRAIRTISLPASTDAVKSLIHELTGK